MTFDLTLKFCVTSDFTLLDDIVIVVVVVIDVDVDVVVAVMMLTTS